ncbi:MAG TPA: carboxypeptidase-like regulatory domain-containing protein [Longimicrobium sp.]|nr:carboxypeptidase-like regulatory domain-containing protein [Longimicrobium sp.]
MRSIRGIRHLAALFSAAVLAAPAAAGQTLQGRVVDDATGAPVAQVSVAVMDIRGRTVRGATTNDAGAFAVALPETGRYTLRASRLGYTTVTTPPLDVLTTDSMAVEVRIATGAVPLAPLTVTAQRAPMVADGTLMRRGFYTRRTAYERLGGLFLDREYLDQRNAFRTTDIFRDLGGVRVQPGPSRSLIVTLRGGCVASVFIDGAHINRAEVASEEVSANPTSIRDGMGRNQEDPTKRTRSGPEVVSIDELVNPASIAAIEVYQGNQVPAEFQSFRARPCGAVVIWTGRETN